MTYQDKLDQIIANQKIIMIILGAILDDTKNIAPIFNNMISTPLGELTRYDLKQLLIREIRGIESCRKR